MNEREKEEGETYSGGMCPSVDNKKAQRASYEIYFLLF